MNFCLLQRKNKNLESKLFCRGSGEYKRPDESVSKNSSSCHHPVLLWCGGCECKHHVCYVCTRFVLLYSLISKNSSRSTNFKTGMEKTFKLSLFMYLQPIICLARVIQIVTKSRIIMSLSNLG